ncbi:biopolymer transporter ExbD [Bosea caraganae]|nr:biopolymer transporter ExbD [Bosea caraganae]
MPTQPALLTLLLTIAPLTIAEAQVPPTLPEHPGSTLSSGALEARLRDDLSALVEGEVVASDDLIAAIDRKTGGDKATRIAFGASRSADFRAVMAVMKRLNDAGFRNVALVTLP